MHISIGARETEDGSTTGLVQAAGLHLTRVHEIATKSKNLRSDLQKALRDSSSAVKGILEALAGRTTDDEVRTLRAANQSPRES